MKYQMLSMESKVIVADEKQVIAQFHGSKAQSYAELFISLVSLGYTADKDTMWIGEAQEQYIDGVQQVAAKVLNERDRVTPQSVHERIVPNQKDESEQPEPGNNVSDPEFWATGIKVKNGKEFYKCHYRCPNCNNAGKHYIPRGLPTVTCHNCGFDMTVRDATPERFPNRDQNGNFYVAYTLG